MARKEGMTIPMNMMRSWVGLCIFILLSYSPSIGGKKRVTVYASPDRTLGAEVTSIDFIGTGFESRIVFRRADKKPIKVKTFLSTDHEHGFAVMKASWTYDSNFFVFSTVGSGGQLPGRFPTYIYLRKSNAIIPLDPLVGMWVTTPDFELQAPDLLFVTAHDTLRGGVAVDTLYKSIHMNDLH